MVILTLSKNNPIESAKEASFKEDVRTFQDELSMYISKDYTNKAGARDYRIIAVQLEKIQKYIPSFNKNYERKFVIKEDTLVYNEEKLNENELKYVESLNMHKNVKSDSEKVEETPNSYYGKTVNYKTGNSTTDSDITSWKIFYSDGANIYLISSTYVDPDNLPEKDGAKPDQGDAETYPKGARFNNILSKYSGSADITDEKIRELNFEYFVTNNFTSIESNMKAVAYMLDTKIWNKYAGGNGAEYAIGGPTIEMLLKSYCGKYPNKDYRAKAVSDIGYQISKNGDTNYSNSITSILNRSDNLYVLPNSSGANVMGLASPSNYRKDCIMHLGYGGSVSFGSYENPYIGFRPVICLKSNVNLAEGTDGYDYNIEVQ